jgi:ubiquinone biosynthesis monooxygenase Coq7
MTEVAACLNAGEALGDRILKVVHAGEHGAVNIYRGQRIGAFLRDPSLRAELAEFQRHEERHREIFGSALAARGRRRCRSYLLCGMGGLGLGIFTGLLGRDAIGVTTVAVERVVLRHLEAYQNVLLVDDPGAWRALSLIVDDEKAHHDRFAQGQPPPGPVMRLLDRIVAFGTEAVIWTGMRL